MSNFVLKIGIDNLSAIEITNFSSSSLSIPRNEKLQWANEILNFNSFNILARTTLSIPPLQATNIFLPIRNGNFFSI